MYDVSILFIVSFLCILGVTDDYEIDRLCNTVITYGYLRNLRGQKDSIEIFTNMARYVGALCIEKRRLNVS